MCAIDSPSGPGKTAALGCACTTFHIGSLARVRRDPPVQSPYRHSPTRSSTCRGIDERAIAEHQIGGLLRALERRRDDRGERHRAQPLGQGARLLLAAVVEHDPGSPSSEHAVGIGLRPSMTDEQHGGHARQRRSCRLMQHNVRVIKGLGWYHADGHTTMEDLDSIPGIDLPDDHDLPAALADLRRECDEHPGSFVWIGLFEPSRDELAAVAAAFELDQLQVDDAANPSQRAKFEFGDEGRIFGLLKLLDYGGGTSDVVTGQVAIFIGSWFAVTVRHGEAGDLTAVRTRIRTSPKLRAHGPFGVLYGVIDSAVDAYVAVMDELTDDIDEVEVQVFADSPSRMSPQVIYNLKRENQEVRRAVTPLVVPAHMFVNHDVEDIPPGLRHYFRDIGEHILRVSDAVDSADNLLLTLLMASTALQDLQQNKDMRKISAWVAIAAVPTALAAIYGMNFDNMPELHSDWGYPAVLGVMAVACVTLFRAFKRSGWL